MSRSKKMRWRNTTSRKRSRTRARRARMPQELYRQPRTSLCSFVITFLRFGRRGQQSRRAAHCLPATAALTSGDPLNSETPASGNRQPLAAQLHIPIPPAPDLGAAAGLAAFAACFFLRALLGGKMLFMRDITVVWYPVVSSFIRSVAAGSWPMWDPYRGFGKPLLADPSAMIAYPFTWLNLFLPLHVYYLWFVLAHLAGSAWGTYALARRWGMSRPGAFTAGAIWVGSGPLLSLADLWHHFAGAAWIPWVFLAAERALARRTVGRALAWGAVLGAQLLAGSADMALLTILALASYVLALHVEWRRPWAP